MRLTKRQIDRLEPEATDYVHWDDQLRGFGVRVWPSGRKAFLVKYRNAHGRQRKMTLGSYGTLTVDEARTLAQGLLADVRKGADPAQERKRDRSASTVRTLCNRFLEEHAEPKKAPSSVREDRRLIERHVLPDLGSLSVRGISREDVLRVHHKLRDRPYLANRVLALLSKMFNLAELWGFRADNTNPCRHVAKYREEKRERFLTPDELAALVEALRDDEKAERESPWVISAIRLLILTGCRMSEILTLRWEDVDYDNASIYLRRAKSGPRSVYLNDLAIDVLRKTPAVDMNPHVIVGYKRGRHLVDLEKPWRRVRKRAGLEDLRIHDLRHSFASLAVSAGYSLPIIGKLLGHTQAQTTSRYAHLSSDPLPEAVNHLGDRLSEITGNGRNGRADT